MIAIIGSGLAGLTAGKVLALHNREFSLFEADLEIGGRVKSEVIDGYRLDHGFQVLLDSYPMVKKHIDLQRLNLAKFSPGARIKISKEKFTTVSDPFRDPKNFLSTIFSPIGSLEDKLKILELRMASTKEVMPTREYLQDFGLSEEIIQRFFIPFYSGVLLEKKLDSPANYFCFLNGQFAQGLACLPEEGMGAIATQLASTYLDKIHLGKKLISLRKDDKVNLEFQDGTSLKADKVILALDGKSIGQFVPHIQSNDFQSVTTYYFKAPKRDYGSYLFLNGEGKGIINHVAVVSSVQPSYAPSSSDLFSVNCIGSCETTPEDILKELESWSFSDVNKMSFLKKFTIPMAQPANYYQGQMKNNEGPVFIAGDVMETPCIEGAMRSGEKAALAALA